jgi:hypothetical protein
VGRWRVIARQDINGRWTHNELEVKVDDRNFIHEFNENNNISFANFDVQQPQENIPDLIIHSVRLMPADREKSQVGYYEVGREEELEIAVTIMNNNFVRAAIGDVVVKVSDGGGWENSQTVRMGAGAGGGVNVTLRLNTSEIDTRERELRVVVDPDNRITEVNENNNGHEYPIRVKKTDIESDELVRRQNIPDPAEAQPAPKLKRTSARVTLMQVRALSPANRSTNPFDFREVASDVSAAQQPGNNQNQVSGEHYPITLTTTFTPLFMVSPGNPLYLPIESGGIGTNTLGDFTLTSGAGTALLIANSFDIPTLQNQVSFFAKEGWTIISQSTANPVPFTDATLVLKRNSDNYYFKITTKIYASASAMDIFTLSGYNCGPSQADCP